MSATKLRYITGDLFAAPSNSILIHACNTLGSWGAGIALVFRDKYPDAFEVYKAHCKNHSNDELIGTCLIIRGGQREDCHDIACLFTSKAFGKKKDSVEDILVSTGSAVKDLIRQNVERKALHACRINSGKFAVPWSSTATILDELGVEMSIYDPMDSEAKK